mgnify:CR=1 FL=1
MCALSFLRQYQLGQVQRVATPQIYCYSPLSPLVGTPLRKGWVTNASIKNKGNLQRSTSRDDTVVRPPGKRHLTPPGSATVWPGRFQLTGQRQIRPYCSALLRRNGRPRSSTISRLSATGRQTANPWAISGGISIKLSMASPPSNPIAASAP